MKKAFPFLVASIGAVTASGQVSDFSRLCNDQMDSEMEFHFKNHFVGESKATQDFDYMSELKELMREQCRGQLSETDVEGILDAARRLEKQDTAFDTLTERDYSEKIKRHVKLGIDHALYGVCRKNLGETERLSQCVCTSIVMNNQVGWNTRFEQPDCN